MTQTERIEILKEVEVVATTMKDISEEFCRGAAIKYLIRFGKKEGKKKEDLMKCIHYVTLMYYYSGVDDKCSVKKK